MRARRTSVVLILLSVLISVPLLISAAESKAEELYALQRSEAVSDDLYAAGGTVTVAGTVEGDLVAAGGDITISGRVMQDAIVAGGTISFLGTVGDDLRAAGGRIQITGTVGGDAVIAGGQVYAVAGSSVGGDMITAAGRVIMDAEVRGRVKIIAGEVTINGPVTGDIDITADRIVIGEKALVSGNVTYTSPRQAAIHNGAIIKGKTSYEKIEEPPHRVALMAVMATWIIARYLMLLTAALIAVLVFKRLSQGVVEGAITRFGGELLTGFVVLIVVPAAVLISFITVIGVPVGIVGLFLYGLLYVLSSVFAGLVIGSLLQKVLFKQSAPQANWKAALLGVTAAGLIPLVGWLFKLVFFLTAFGVISRKVYAAVWAER